MFPFSYNQSLSTRAPERIGIYQSSREDYLEYVVLTHAATDEETAEYRALVRPRILINWDNHVQKIEKINAQDQERRDKDIVYHKRQAIKLRSHGLFDFANKREEYILHLERSGNVYNLSLQGFIKDWGDKELNIIENPNSYQANFSRGK